MQSHDFLAGLRYALATINDFIWKMTADLFSVVKLISFKAVSLIIILNTPYHIAYGIIQTTCYIVSHR